jgi:hypothetical protein
MILALTIRNRLYQEKCNLNSHKKKVKRVDQYSKISANGSI